MQISQTHTEDGYPAVGQYVFCESPFENVTGQVVQTNASYFYVDDEGETIRVNPETVSWYIISKAEFYADQLCN